MLLCVQANYGLKDYESALADFGSVLQIDPENKAARQQLVIASNKVREQRQKERQTYAGMFDKLAKIDSRKVNWVQPTLTVQHYIFITLNLQLVTINFILIVNFWNIND